MPKLQKEISLFGLIMIATGSCIGSGIFATPHAIAQHLPNGLLILGVWLLGGIVSITGSLSFAELASRYPKNGGVYVFLKEAYGSLVAFLYGWCILTVITSGAIAALCLVFAKYVDVVVPIGDRGVLFLAAAAIVFVSFINIRGVKWGDNLSKILTVLKLAGIFIIILIGLYYTNLSAPSYTSIGIEKIESMPVAFAAALVGVIFSFGGWHHASYLAAEVKNAKKIIPKAMIIGSIIVTCVYLLSNVAYLNLLGVEGIAADEAVAANAMTQVAPSASLLISILIAVSTLGAAGIYTLTAPRIYYQMAEDGNFFKFLAKIHPQTKVPVNAILVQSGWALVLLFAWSTFQNLIEYVVFMDWVFMTMAAISLFIFRKRSNSSSAYKVPLYPITPAIFIIISTWFVVYLLLGRPVQAFFGIGLLLIGVLVYFVIKKNKNVINTQ